MAPTITKSVRPAGRAVSSTLVIKCPLMMFLLGSSASRNPGTPMVNILISEICDGSRGYSIMKEMENRAIRKEKIFFTRKRLPERCRLLTTRLPSRTTEGMQAKLDSSRTS